MMSAPSAVTIRTSVIRSDGRRPVSGWSGQSVGTGVGDGLGVATATGDALEAVVADEVDVADGADDGGGEGVAGSVVVQPPITSSATARPPAECRPVTARSR